MNKIPTVAFQILAPSEGVADGSLNGLWFKVKSDPHPTDDLIVGLRVCASDGSVRQSGVIVISKGESHSSEFFFKTITGEQDVRLEIEPSDSLARLEFPILTNEGYVIEAGHEFLEYKLGNLSKIVPYQKNEPNQCLWTDESR